VPEPGAPTTAESHHMRQSVKTRFATCVHTSLFPRTAGDQFVLSGGFRGTRASRLAYVLGLGLMKSTGMGFDFFSRAFRRGSSAGLPPRATVDLENVRIGAAVQHVDQNGHLDDFPAAQTEKVALMRTAARQGLVIWNRARQRYELTSLGRQRLGAPRAPEWVEQHLPRPRRGAGAIVIAGAAGAALGAALVAALPSRAPNPANEANPPVAAAPGGVASGSTAAPENTAEVARTPNTAPTKPSGERAQQAAADSSAPLSGTQRAPVPDNQQTSTGTLLAGGTASGDAAAPDSPMESQSTAQSGPSDRTSSATQQPSAQSGEVIGDGTQAGQTAETGRRSRERSTHSRDLARLRHDHEAQHPGRSVAERDGSKEERDGTKDRYAGSAHGVAPERRANSADGAEAAESGYRGDLPTRAGPPGYARVDPPPRATALSRHRAEHRQTWPERGKRRREEHADSGRREQADAPEADEVNRHPPLLPFIFGERPFSGRQRMPAPGYVERLPRRRDYERRRATNEGGEERPHPPGLLDWMFR
jgi:hypothetical protein